MASISLRILGSAVLLAIIPTGRIVGGETDSDGSFLTDVSVVPGTWNDLRRYVRSQKGKVVVVDIWSTSCVPCMEEFPRLVQLQNTMSKDVVCVSFNIDYAGAKKKPPEYFRPRVEKFLRYSKARFRNYLCTTEADVLYKELELTSIPAVYVYGADGQLARRFDASLLEHGKDEPFTYAKDVVPFVKRQVKLARSLDVGD